MELLNYSVENIEFSDGRKNEQIFSKHIYDKLSNNSLVLKDLGYFKFDDFNIIESSRLRWQIELLFKFFKSDFQLDKIKNLKIERIETHLYATLIKMILLLEITKNIYDGFPKEMSIRRVLKSSSNWKITKKYYCRCRLWKP